MSRVLPNDADQHVEQKLPLLRSKRVKNALVGGRILLAKPVKYPFALRREPQDPGASVSAINATFDKTPFAKLLDKEANMGSFNTESRGKAVLIYSGLAVSLVETG